MIIQHWNVQRRTKLKNKVCKGHLVPKSWDFIIRIFTGNVRVQCRFLLPRRVSLCTGSVQRSAHAQTWFRCFICITAFWVFRIRVCFIKFESHAFSESKSPGVNFSCSLPIRLFHLLTIYSVNTYWVFAVYEVAKERKQLLVIRNSVRQTNSYKWL